MDEDDELIYRGTEEYVAGNSPLHELSSSSVSPILHEMKSVDTPEPRSVGVARMEPFKALPGAKRLVAKRSKAAVNEKGTPAVHVSFRLLCLGSLRRYCTFDSFDFADPSAKAVARWVF